MLKIKRTLDIMITILLLFLMCYPIMDSQIHEILGVMMMICFIIHHVLNRQWYHSLLKGHYPLLRKIILIINTLLFIDLILVFISGLTMSDIFPFFNFIRASTARRLHMSLTHWSFILMAIHLGLHLQSMLIPIQKRIKKSHFPHILMYIPYVLAIYGIIMFINYQWVDYLFILNEFLFFNPSITLPRMMLDIFSIFLFFTILTYIFIKYLMKRK